MEVDLSFTEEYEDYRSNLKDTISTVPEFDVFIPNVADEQKIGFFSLDRATQTEDSEILDLKQMTDIIRTLTEDAGTMRRDITFAKSVMQAEFETKLQHKSIDLHIRMNEKVAALESVHQERLAKVRRAFRQQLSDAIARIHALYTKNFESKQNKELRKEKFKMVVLEEKVKAMQTSLNKKDEVIEMLKEHARKKEMMDEEKMKASLFTQITRPTTPATMTPTPEPKAAAAEHEEDDEEEDSADKVDLEEYENVKQELERINSKMNKLEGSYDSQVMANKTLEKEVMDLRQMLENEQSHREKLEMELENSAELQREKEDILSRSVEMESRHNLLAENEKLQMQREMEERMKRARDEALREARAETASMATSGQARLNQLLDENKTLKLLLETEREKGVKAAASNVDLDLAKRNEQKLLKEVAKLKKEIDRVHRAWEKKFNILQASLHALKDESYLRQQLQRQAAQLHQAAINYSYDHSAPPSPNKLYQPPKLQQRRPLPEINKPHSPQGLDCISYTVSAPSGRGTTMFSVEENQVMSDSEVEDIPADVQPLPSPPPRSAATEAADSRPATRKSSINVVLPTADSL